MVHWNSKCIAVIPLQFHCNFPAIVCSVGLLHKIPKGYFFIWFIAIRNELQWFHCNSTAIICSAYLSSVSASMSTVKAMIPVSINDHQDSFYRLGSTEWMIKLNRNTLPENPLFQEEWDKPLYIQRHKELLESAPSDTERACILCISQDHASDWLHAVPIPSLGLKLSDSHLRAICALQNGSLICQQHTCLCGKKVDQLGRHGLSCMKQIGRHPRHSNVNDLIKRALSHADIPSRLEPQGLDPNNCNLRPDGITLFPYKEGKCLVWDFTCVDTMARSHLKETCKQPGAAAEKAEKVKNDKYKNLQRDYYLVPVAVETLGAWNSAGATLIKTLGKIIQKKLVKSVPNFSCFKVFPWLCSVGMLPASLEL